MTAANDNQSPAMRAGLEAVRRMAALKGVASYRKRGQGRPGAIGGPDLPKISEAALRASYEVLEGSDKDQHR